MLCAQVIVSADRGLTWSLVTAAAPWSARSDIVTAVQPGTNNVVMLGGANDNNGTDFADIWLSTDGSGAVWKRVNASAFAIADAEMTWLPDAGSGTIVLYDYITSQLLQSTNMGASFVAVANLATIAASQPGAVVPQSTGALIFDGDSNLYLVGGGTTPAFWFSADKGVTWKYLPQTNKTVTGFQDVVTLKEFSYSCLSVIYSASTTAPSGYHRSLVLYGGFLDAAINYDVSVSSVCQAPSTAYESMLVDVILAGESSTAGADLLAVPPSNLAASIDFHSPIKPANLFSPQYPTCAYDVHAIANRSTTPRMWQVGGFSPDYSQMYNRVSFTQSNFATVAAYYPSYTGNSSAISGRVAGGAAYLNNGALLWMGGKVSTTAGLANDVVYSTNNGQSFAVSTTAALWSARSDFSTVVLPLTNTVTTQYTFSHLLRELR